MKKTIFKDATTLIILIFVTSMQISCYQKFYQVADDTGRKAVDSNVQQKTGKYFILRSGRNAFYMSDIALTDSNRLLGCTLDKVDDKHTVYLNYDLEKSMTYKASKGQDVVLNEVHIYIPADTSLHYGNKYSLDLKKVTKVEILGKDEKKTKNNATWSTVGIAVGVVAVALTIYIVAVNSMNLGLGWGP